MTRPAATLRGTNMTRDEVLRNKKPDMVVDLWIYPSERGAGSIRSCSVGVLPARVQQQEGAGWVGYDGWPQLGDTKMEPGDSRRVGYLLAAGQEAVAYLSAAERFYVWDGGIRAFN